MTQADVIPTATVCPLCSGFGHITLEFGFGYKSEQVTCGECHGLGFLVGDYLLDSGVSTKEYWRRWLNHNMNCS